MVSVHDIVHGLLMDELSEEQNNRSMQQEALEKIQDKMAASGMGPINPDAVAKLSEPLPTQPLPQ